MTQPNHPAFHPFDQHNRELESHVHPPEWINPTPTKPYHLVVIGAGTAGLVTAAGAAGLGARVALIERDLMGGDCLNVGCVPSKALLSSARAAANVRDANELGVEVPDGTQINFANMMQRMRRLRAKISPVDSAQRFSELGVDVFFGTAQFAKSSAIEITRRDGTTQTVHFKKAVIATGARAAAPPIPGLDTVNYLTNETLFSLTELPPVLGIIGGGPIGVEMAQVFARCGSEVHLLEKSDRILSKADDEAARIVQAELTRDGVQFFFRGTALHVAPTDDKKIRLSGKQNGHDYSIIVDQLLVATGRQPNTENLNLSAVNVDHDKYGVTVNDFLQTTNSRIYAAGDVCTKSKFTHAADFMARIVIQNSLFAIGPFGRKRFSKLIIPATTYTSPEIAHVGATPDEASAGGIEVATYVQSFEHVDRAIVEGNTMGFVKVHTHRGSDKILGATIVAQHAGDLISEITLAMNNHIGLSKIAGTIHPYPTLADAIRRLGDQYNKTKLTPLNKRILRWLLWFNANIFK